MNIIEEDMKYICQLIWDVQIQGNQSPKWQSAWNAIQETLNGTLSVILTDDLKKLEAAWDELKKLKNVPVPD